jgi:glycosyltransferase involved in cell wall biosynthesis
MTMRNKFINKIEKDINLKKTLNLILNRDYKNIKIILSNNGSTDGTSKFLNKISKTDNRIKVYNQNQEITINNNFIFVLSKTLVNILNVI